MKWLVSDDTERADTGSLSDAGPICQNTLQLRIKASLLFK